MISSMSEPASRFSKTVATGIRVPLKTHAPLRLQHMCLLLPELLVCLAAIIRVIQHPVWPSDRRPGYDAFRDQILGQLKVSLNQLPRDGRAARQKLVDRE